MDVTYVRTMEEVKACETSIMITNYERVRDGEVGVRIDPNYFTVTSLDEAWKSRACLTPEGKAMLTPENFFILTPLKS